MDVLQGEEFFRSVADHAPPLMWLAAPDGYIYWYNRCWYEYTGTEPEQMAGWGWQIVHDPKKLPEVMAAWKQSIETGQPFEMAFPLRSAKGEYRTFLTRVNPIKNDSGAVVRWLGTNTDIEAQAEAERHLQLVVFELNHRVKNILAMVLALAKRTLRSCSTLELETFTKRLIALGGAHDTLARQQWRDTTLKAIVDEGLSGFGSREDGRLSIVGPELMIPPKRAASWAMAIHELATNAVKYGAWAVDDGKVQIAWEELGSGQMKFVWRESGGPPVVGPQNPGFGSRLIKAVGAELGGSATISYAPDGLVCELVARTSSN